MSLFESFASLFVNRPLNLLALAGLILLAWGILRFGGLTAVRHPNALVVPLVFVLLFSLWEWLVTVRTPEANIRVDLLLIWPVFFILLIGSLVRTFR